MNDLADRIVKAFFTGFGCFGLSLFGFLGVCLLAVNYAIARDIFLQWRSSTYPETHGIVTHSKASPRDSGTSHYFVVHYNYTINGKQYTGEKYKFTLESGYYAHQLAAEFPVGETVPVYYCSNQPQRAILRTGLALRDSFVPLFVLPFNGMLLIAIYGFLLHGRYRRLFRNKRHWFRDFPIQDDGSMLRLRTGFHALIPMAIVGTLPALFVAMPFFFVYGDIHEVPIMIGWGAVVVGGVFGFWLAIRWNRSGFYDLIVDKARGELVLPRQPDKTPGPIVPFDSIEDITHSRMASAMWSDTTMDNHILTLHYRNGNETQSAIVVSEHNRVGFFGFIGNDEDEETELTELKHWILRESGRDCPL